MRQIIITFFLSLMACVQMPKGIEAVNGFEIQRYMGRWYEIARLDHRFERGLKDIYADYSPMEDGSVQVINSGFDMKLARRKTAQGKALLVETPDKGRLKVSFFGPFYGAYNIIALDKQHYQWAMVCGADRDSLWILARSPDLDKTVVENLVRQAKSMGFATDDLIFDRHGA